MQVRQAFENEALAHNEQCSQVEGCLPPVLLRGRWRWHILGKERLHVLGNCGRLAWATICCPDKVTGETASCMHELIFCT